MLTLNRVRRGLVFFVSGKVASGLLGLLWLTALVRTLDQTALGVYFALISIFEIGQLLSSVGLYSFVQRYLSKAYLQFTRAAFARVLIKILLVRVLTLVALGIALFFFWQHITRWQGWDTHHLVVSVIVAYVVFEGMLRFLDAIFECIILQGYSQLISVLRNVLRLVFLMVLVRVDQAITVMTVFKLEMVLASVFLLVGLMVLAWQTRSLPQQREQMAVFDLRRIIGFSWHGYLALAAGQFYGLDAFRLLVGYFSGPAVVATYGLAQSLADVIRRYMPIQLFLGFVRSVIVARYETSGNVSEAAQQASILHKINAFFLVGVTGWAAACGSDALRLLSSHHGYGESGPYFAGFMVLLGIQALRIVLSLLATVGEDNRSILIATLVSGVGVVLAWVLIPLWGPWGAIAGLLMAELLYVLVLRVRLKVDVARFLGNGSGYIRMVVVAAMAALLVHELPLNSDLPGLVLRSLLFAALYLGLLAIWKPFSQIERAAINKLMPVKGFIW